MWDLQVRTSDDQELRERVAGHFCGLKLRSGVARLCARRGAVQARLTSGVVGRKPRTGWWLIVCGSKIDYQLNVVGNNVTDG